MFSDLNKCKGIPVHGPGSSVGIATGHGLDGPGIESRWGREFPQLSRPSLGPTNLLYNGYRVFPAGKERPRRDTDPLPPSSALVMKEQSYTSTPPMGRTACTETQCLYKSALYLYLIPVQTWRGPESSRISMFPEFLDNPHIKVASYSGLLTRRPYPQEISLVLICVRS